MTASPLHALRLNAVELLRQPGSEREVQAMLASDDLDIHDDRIVGAIEVSLRATSSIDGIAVHGTVTVPWRASCRRCLAVVPGSGRAGVDERYQYDPADEDVYEIEHDRVDLVPAVREYVLLELPDDPLCRADCKGLCPVCGIDRNGSTCTCDTTVRDERWAALDGLKLDDGPDA